MIQSRRWKPPKASAIETSEVLTIVDSSVDRKRATHSLLKRLLLVYQGEKKLNSSFFFTLSLKGTAEEYFLGCGM
jgi:hypothetical protein